MIEIPFNKLNAKYRDRNWMNKQYIKKEKSTREIAAMIGVGITTIYRWLKKHGIKTRSIHNKAQLNDKVKKFTTGSLLGDGSLGCRSSYSARYSIGQKHKEYCEWVSQLMEGSGIKQSGEINQRNINKVISYHYRTLDYDIFKKIHNKWYPNGAKIVPQDIRLTPIVLRHWFIEDGSSFYNNNHHQTIQLATNGFTKKGVNLLALKLAKFLKVKQDLIHIYQDRGYKLSFGNGKVLYNFYSKIADLPKELQNVYGYKWKVGDGHSVAA